jgi:hypothetical protein
VVIAQPFSRSARSVSVKRVAKPKLDGRDSVACSHAM